MNCAAENCVNNNKGLCVVESMISICEDSKCALYQTSPEKQIKVLTKKVEMLANELRRSSEENEMLMKQIEELKKTSVYPPVGTTVWVEDAMWGVVPCVIDGAEAIEENSSVYDLHGRRQTTIKRGLNIIRTIGADGTVKIKKVFKD